MKPKPVTPYQRLLKIAQEYVAELSSLHERSMWLYPKDRLDNGNWALGDLKERVAAAEQLGYDVVLKASERGLEVRYRKQVPNAPWELKP